MEALLGFHVDFWDYVTFAAMFVIVAAALSAAILILGLPGRIAWMYVGKATNLRQRLGQHRLRAEANPGLRNWLSKTSDLR